MKRTNTMLSLLAAVCVFCLILTVSIGLPIYIRPFYYAHIEALELQERSGYTAEEIRQAYDQVLDYLTIPGKPFGTGKMANSESGKDHFKDCRGLFFLNGGVLITSGGILSLLTLLRRKGKLAPLGLRGRSPVYWGALAVIVIPVVVGILAALDFDRAFVVFHAVFFPGKDNWRFNSNADEIIRVLPQQFFMHCAMFIGGGLLSLSGGLLLWESCKKRKERKWIKP